jgi:hypothetical protein
LKIGTAIYFKARDTLNATTKTTKCDYDAVGNRQSEKYNHLATPVWDTYYYDTLRRLAQANYAASSGYVFNSVDGRLSMDELVLLASHWLDSETLDLDRIYGIYKIVNNPVDSVNPVKKYSSVNTPNSKLRTKNFSNIYSLTEFGETADDTAQSAVANAETIWDEQGNISAQIVYDDNGNIALFALYPDSGGKVVITSIYDADGRQTSQVFTTYDADGSLVSREEILAAENTEVSSSVIPAQAGIQFLLTPDFRILTSFLRTPN